MDFGGYNYYLCSNLVFLLKAVIKIMRSKVVVLKTSTQTVLADYARLMHLANYQEFFSKDIDILIKLNLTWTLFFPGCSSPPWQLEGVLKTMFEDEYSKEKIFPVENKTVVTEPVLGARNNKWLGVLNKYHLPFIPLMDVKWIEYKPKRKMLILDKIFPEGIFIPETFIGKSIVHLPTLKTHGHTVTTGAIKNAFGGLLRENRHYCHKYIHETLVDLLAIQQEIHPAIFAVMDATICGDGAGPRTLIPKIKNYILASADSVAIDAVAAKLMGLDPLKIPYLKMATENQLGTANLKDIEIIGEDISKVNFAFQSKRSPVIQIDQALRLGPLRFLEHLALHTHLAIWAPIASTIYHDYFWYLTIGRVRLSKFKQTEWGKLFDRYENNINQAS